MELSPTKTRYITLTLTFICYSTVSFILPLVILPLYQQSAVSNHNNQVLPGNLLGVTVYMSGCR